MFYDLIIIGNTGLIGSDLINSFSKFGMRCLGVNSTNYKHAVGSKSNLLINCNGNNFRYKANENPVWDFKKSVESVINTIFDFSYKKYLYISTIDVYSDKSDPDNNYEGIEINLSKLDTYGYNKWLAERIIEKFTTNYIIFRTGTVLGQKLRKGPVFDLLSGNELFMSSKSELSFIDTENIFLAIKGALDQGIKNEIVNLVGTGSITLDSIIKEFPIKAKFASDSKRKIYKYNINNKKLKSFYSIKHTSSITKQFIKEYNFQNNKK